MQNGNLKNIVTLHLRAFPVVACDERTDETHALMVPVTKQQLKAAQIVGQSSKELIERLCSRQGFTVIEIGTPDKLTAELDLAELYESYSGEAAHVVICSLYRRQ